MSCESNAYTIYCSYTQLFYSRYQAPSASITSKLNDSSSTYFYQLSSFTFYSQIFQNIIKGNTFTSCFCSNVIVNAVGDWQEVCRWILRVSKRQAVGGFMHSSGESGGMLCECRLHSYRSQTK